MMRLQVALSNNLVAKPFIKKTSNESALIIQKTVYAMSSSNSCLNSNSILFAQTRKYISCGDSNMPGRFRYFSGINISNDRLYERKSLATDAKKKVVTFLNPRKFLLCCVLL